MPIAPEEMTLKVIAHIHTAFPTKFGIPRQSGLVDSLRGEVIFTPEYRSADAVRGLEDFSHIWLASSKEVLQKYSCSPSPHMLEGCAPPRTCFISETFKIFFISIQF